MVRISKFLSYILRHNPKWFNLKIDRNGYVQVNDILVILKERFRGVSKKDLLELVKDDNKGRFEILNEKIRATYGHSIAVWLPNPPVKPPEILYHGSAKEATVEILKKGIKPMRRQYVHLSRCRRDALKIGLRHTQKPVVLYVSALKAHIEGIEFFKEANTYLVRFIPKEYITRCED